MFTLQRLQLKFLFTKNILIGRTHKTLDIFYNYNNVNTVKLGYSNLINIIHHSQNEFILRIENLRNIRICKSTYRIGPLKKNAS